MAFGTDAGGDDGVFINIDAGWDEASKRAFVKAMEDIIRLINAKTAKNAFSQAHEDLRKAARAASDFEDYLKRLAKEMNLNSREAARLAEYLKGIGIADRVAASATARARTTDRAAAITQRELLSAAARERIEILRNEGRVQFVEAQKNLVQTREAGKKRILITQEVLRTIARAEKAAGAVIASTARTTASVISKTFSGITSLFRRQGNQIADGLDGPLRRRERDLYSSFSRQEQTLRRSVVRQEQTITQLNQKLSRGVLGAATGRGVGGGLLGGLAAGGGVLALLTSGFQRFSDLERINKQFLALTGNIDDTNRLLAEVKQFAKETPFDLVGVADLAKGFLAIKTPVDQVLPRVKAIADAVALTGGGVEELERIQRALGQIVSAGRLQGDELNQLAENLPGLNIRQILADQLTGGDVPALIKLQEAGKLSADAVVDGLITGLATDPRLAGASGELSKTLSGRFANLKESFGDFGAVLIGTVAGPLKFAITTTQTALQSLADFIRGENLGPLLLLLRDALKGFALGMAAVVAAKGAVETIRLLGLAAKLLATPMGTVLIAVGLLGAAFQVAMKQSEPFREAVGELGSKLKDLWGRIVELVMPALRTVGDFVTTTVIPGFASLADFIGRNLLGALNAVGSFITGALLPPLRSLWEWLSKIAVEGFEWMREKAVAFFDAVRPLVQPAVDGFIGLAKAIQGAFSGDFSGLRSGATGFLSGVGTTIANIAGAIGKALAPAAGAVLRFFQDVFSGPNIKRYASAFLGFVEEVGRIIGSIVSSPVFIKAVVGLAAAAAVIAFKFIQGFTEGVVDHLDDIARLIGDALLTGLKFALSNPQLIVGAIALGVLVQRMRSVFTSVGQGAGDGFLSGLKSRLKGAGQTFTAFISGPTTTRGFALDSTLAVLQKQKQAIANQLRILGGPSVFNLDTKAGFRAAQKEVKQLSKHLTDAQLRGLILRDTLKNVGVAALNIGKGALQVGRGLAQGLISPITSAAKRIGPSIGNFLVNTATGGFVQAGLKSGQTFTQSFKTSLTGAKASIVQGWQTITSSFRQLAQQQGVSVGRLFGQTVASAAVVAVSAYAGGKAAGATGGSPIFAALTAGITGFAITGNPIIGAVAAGVSLIGSAFGAADKKAKEFAEAVKKAADSIKNELKDAVEKGLVDLAALADGLQLKDIGGLNAAQQAFRDAVSDADLKTLSTFGIDFTALVGSLQAADPAKEIKKMVVQLGFASDIGQNLKANLQAAFGEEEGARRFNATLQKIIDNIDNGRDALDGFTADQRIALSGIDGLIIDVANKAAGAVPKLQAALDSINIENTFFGLDTGDAGKVIGAVGSVDGALQAVIGSLDIINGKFATMFNQGTGGEFQAAIDSATIAAAGIGKRIQDVVANEGAKAVDLTGTGGGAAGAELRDLSRQFSDQIGAVLKAGTDAGIIVDAETAYQYLAPLFNAMIAGVEDPATRDALTQAFSDLIAGVGPAIAAKQQGVDIQLNLEAALAKARGLIQNSPELQGIIDELGGAGSDGANEFVNKMAAVLAVFPQSLTAEGGQLAAFVADGFAKGLTAAEVLAKVRVAAYQLGHEAVRGAGLAVKVSSPSKVFIEIGQFVGQGFAIGIKSTTSEVVQAVTDLMDKTVATATGGPLSTLASTLFGQLTGSGSPLAFDATNGATRGAVTSAVNSFLGQFDSNVSQLKAIAGKSFASLTAAQKDLFGESATSLDVTDVIGAQNVASITSTLDAISRYGQQLLASGTSAEDVSKIVTDLVAQFIYQAAQLGFDPAGLYDIVDQLGLSQSALADFLDVLQNTQVDSGNTNTLLGSGGSTGGWTGRVQIENNIYLPTGDPEAAALAVANRQASWLFG